MFDLYLMLTIDRFADTEIICFIFLNDVDNRSRI